MRSGIGTTALVVLCAASAGATADEASHREAAAELLEASRAEAIIDQVYAQMPQMLSAMSAQMGLPPEKAAEVEEAMPSIMDFMTEKMSWEVLEPEYVAIYAENYSEEDLRGLTDFYQSDLGQRFLESTPQVMQQSSEVVQQRMMTIVPELMERMQSIVEEQP